MFRQIYELTVLGMHPAIQCPRRSQIRPLRVGTAAGGSVPTDLLIVPDEVYTPPPGRR